ncbi:nitrogenase-stabilizing/protective protein NifW [Vibrio hippocampi]|uniref:Nitrogenase-stabilizing/protective protein NifW n=1 Tax=Vibrio hippocampi TaxID=654686 RepID=A0ABM8ZLI8_9VIBR|nr:nitrogenase-stabilizing/protective protein NifW [Vibrio hippocampi]CAH0529315.1 Nitrogenase-stabilizing/protective protein NifW [Vibrio hippocampi]
MVDNGFMLDSGLMGDGGLNSESHRSAPSPDWQIEMESFVDLEQYFELFDVSFDSEVLAGRRVAILGWFNKELSCDAEPAVDYHQYQAALRRAYCKAMRGETWLKPVNLCGSCRDCD